MTMKLLFNGFRHGHINALYKLASASALVDIAGCIENDEPARKKAEERCVDSVRGLCYSEKKCAEKSDGCGQEN